MDNVTEIIALLCNSSRACVPLPTIMITNSGCMTSDCSRSGPVRDERQLSHVFLRFSICGHLDA
jgi:hypothetical protein